MQKVAATAGTERPAVPPRAGLALIALASVAFVCNLNIAAATVALPSIGLAFDASQFSLNLVGLGAGLGLSMSVLYSGAIADRYGRKQILIVGLFLTILANTLSAMAPSVEFLIGARVFTGVAAGMAFPTTLSLITALWADGPKRTSSIAVWSASAGMASVSGAILGGLMLQWFSWPAVFLLSVPIAVIALTLIIAVIPSHVGESDEKVDHLGGVLSIFGVATLVLGISFVFTEAGRPVGLTLFLFTIIFFALFFWRQQRAENPLFDLGVAKRRLFWAPAVAGAFVFGGLVGAIFIGIQFMENILSYSALEAGLAVIPSAFGLILMAPVAANTLTKYGTRVTMLVGYMLVVICFVTMLMWREDTHYILIGFSFLAIGCGATFVTTSASRALTSSTPVRRVGMASATSDLQGDLGGSVVQALLGAILAAGFASKFSDLIHNAHDDSAVGPTIKTALQSSFSSAEGVAQKFPQYKDAILQAARESLLAGALEAYLVGGIVILLGVVLVLFAIPKRSKELELLGEYSRLNRQAENV